MKVYETRKSIEAGAQEIDMVMNLGAFKMKDYDTVRVDIQSVVHAAASKPVKVIIETGLLNHDEIYSASQIVLDAGAHFVKTCTGFSGGQATVKDVELIAKAVDGKCLIKASGGIRTHQDAVDLLNAGAHRLGTSAGPKLLG